MRSEDTAAEGDGLAESSTGGTGGAAASDAGLSGSTREPTRSQPNQNGASQGGTAILLSPHPPAAQVTVREGDGVDGVAGVEGVPGGGFGVGPGIEVDPR